MIYYITLNVVLFDVMSIQCILLYILYNNMQRIASVALSCQLIPYNIDLHNKFTNCSLNNKRIVILFNIIKWL